MISEGYNIHDNLSLHKLDRRSVWQQVVSQFFLLIRNGVFSPGDQLPPERELAQNLGVSRASLREALSVLQVTGILEVRQGSGIAISKRPSIDNLLILAGSALLIHQMPLHDLCEVRTVIECEIVKDAAKKITDEEIEYLKQFVSDMRRIQDIEEYIQADLDFHLAIAGSTKNIVWSSIVQLIRILTHEAILKVANLPDRLRIATDEHAEIVRCLELRDPDAAVAAKQKHLSIYLEVKY